MPFAWRTVSKVSIIKTQSEVNHHLAVLYPHTFDSNNSHELIIDLPGIESRYKPQGIASHFTYSSLRAKDVILFRIGI